MLRPSRVKPHFLPITRWDWLILGYVCQKTGVCYLAGDSFYGTTNINFKSSGKVELISDYLGISSTGDPRGRRMLSVLLQSKLDLITAEWLLGDLPDAFRKAALDSGFLSTENGHDKSETTFVVAYDRNLYLLSSGLDITTAQDGFIASGSGEVFGVGALSILDLSGRLQDDPQESLVQVLNAASRWCPYVTSPFTVVTIQPTPSP